MDIITVLEFFIHIDVYMQSIVSTIGIWDYLLIFLIIFLGTAFIFLSFFPGKSLIFIIGALCANGTLNVHISILVFILAAFFGDIINYYIGGVGSKVFHTDSRFLKKEYLIRTNKFYEKYGLSTILITKFISFIRIVAIFV